MPQEYLAYLYIRKLNGGEIVREVGLEDLSPEYIERAAHAIMSTINDSLYHVDTSEAYAVLEELKNAEKLPDDILAKMCKHELTRLYGNEVSEKSYVYAQKGRWRYGLARTLDNGDVVAPSNTTAISKKEFIRRLKELRERGRET